MCGWKEIRPQVRHADAIEAQKSGLTSCAAQVPISCRGSSNRRPDSKAPSTPAHCGFEGSLTHPDSSIRWVFVSNPVGFANKIELTEARRSQFRRHSRLDLDVGLRCLPEFAPLP